MVVRPIMEIGRRIPAETPAEAPSHNFDRKVLKPMLWIIGLLLFLGVGALGWVVAGGGYYEPGDEFGYNLGLIGGLMMLALLIYPLRKRLKFVQRWGAIRFWFSLHMMLGIFGPLLVLFHSTFRISSINAGVALTCMLLVAGSGMIGRYAYTHIHRGLYGSKISLQELESELFGSVAAAESKLTRYPKVLMLLHRFRRYALECHPALPGKLLRFFALPVLRQLANLQCVLLMPKYSRDSRERRQLVLDYLYAVERLAQFGVFERIFALWHVAHIPLVFLLIATACWHVLAVHMY